MDTTSEENFGDWYYGLEAKPEIDWKAEYLALRKQIDEANKTVGRANYRMVELRTKLAHYEGERARLEQALIEANIERERLARLACERRGGIRYVMENIRLEIDHELGDTKTHSEWNLGDGMIKA